MADISFCNARIYDSGTHAFYTGGLTVRNGYIETAGASPGAASLEGRYVIPGLIDTHTHGRGGIDIVGATPEQARRLRRLYASVGVTTVFAAIASAPLDTMLNAAETAADAGFDGIHYEGRYFSAARRGAHNASLLAPPRSEELPALIKAAQGLPVHITVAPELEGAEDFIRSAVAAGATVGIGHSDASCRRALDALDAGAMSFTHLYNAMSPLRHRDPGCVGAAMLGNAYVELICDGVHLDPDTVRLTNKLMGDRVILISDSMAAAGCPDGDYSIAGEEVTVRGGKALTADGAIAGSTGDLFGDLSIYAELCAGADTSPESALAAALPAATEIPAKAYKLQDRGSIKPGMRADMVILEKDMKTIYTVLSAGQPVKQFN